MKTTCEKMPTPSGSLFLANIFVSQVKGEILKLSRIIELRNFLTEAL